MKLSTFLLSTAAALVLSACDAQVARISVADTNPTGGDDNTQITPPSNTPNPESDQNNSDSSLNDVVNDQPENTPDTGRQPAVETPAENDKGEGDDSSKVDTPINNPVNDNPVNNNPVNDNPVNNEPVGSQPSNNDPQENEPNNDSSKDQESSDDQTEPNYVSGAIYQNGDSVTNAGSVFQCTIAAWCSSGHDAYEPGLGWAWESAWSLVGPASTEPEEGHAPSTNPSEEDSTPDNSTPDNSTPDDSNTGTPGAGQPEPEKETNPAPGEKGMTFSAPTAAACLPEGLIQTPGTQANYCDIYDADGREKMDDDHPRRVIGYLTSWRTGYNDQPSYLVNDIPWDKVTHINYAFAHIDSQYHISVGDVSDPENPATGLTWPSTPGAEMDPSYSFNGHFNLLAKYKKQYDDVKTLISVGGWAETGGHFSEDGRVDDGGFYTLTIKENGQINSAAIQEFAQSVVKFLRTYEFDGVDIDYEYPSSMKDSGNPDDFHISNPRRANLWKGYMALMATLRSELDKAGQQDNTHYMLTIASPSSGYLLRGMEAFQAIQYLDYVNIMSYDLHGAWNEFVGPNAALFDDGRDNELSKWGVYNAKQYEGIGYLNTDWAYHYFRGAMQAGRINIGIPYYTRGWQSVRGGENGLWGKAPVPAGVVCPAGTGNSCGYGAQGIDNLWHDLDPQGNELFAGSNPMWHAMNLAAGIEGSYLSDYGLNTATDEHAKLTGQYQRHYDSTLVASWLWNSEKSVFLSIEDEQSFARKLDWVIDNGIGGVMFWELAGDYDYDASAGEYFMGDTLTSLAYNKLAAAQPYEIRRAEIELPTQTIDVAVDLTDFASGDSNYPINPKLTITNNSSVTLPGGTVFEFDMGTSTGADIIDQSGVGLKVITDATNRAGNNIGGIENDLHRLQFTLPTWQSLKAGESISIAIRYYMPTTLPSNWTLDIQGEVFAIRQEHPELKTVTSMGLTQ